MTPISTITRAKGQSMKRKPSPDMLRTAAEWLACNEGEEGSEKEHCLAVCFWLREMADRDTENAFKQKVFDAYKKHYAKARDAGKSIEEARAIGKSKVLAAYGVQP